MKAISFVICALTLCVSTIACRNRCTSRIVKSLSRKRHLPAENSRGKLERPGSDGTPECNAPVRVSLRVTSGGAAMLHEWCRTGDPMTPARDDDPITMLYVNGDSA